MGEQDDLQLHYARGEERERLSSPLGQVEFERTTEIVSRHLPAAPARVADIGGGPGRYALWLAGQGYAVSHRDIVPLHVEQLRREAGERGLDIDAGEADARALDLADGSHDAALLLGPLYHLVKRRDRIQALREAIRVVRPGGTVIAAAISRWAARLDGQVVERLGDVYPAIEAQVEMTERTGRLPALFPGSFAGYCHRPAQLRGEIRAAGLECIDLVVVEGIAFALHDLEQRLADPGEHALLLHCLRTLERVPELLGIGPHLLAVACRTDRLP